MTIDEALKSVPIHKRRYFRWKNNYYTHALAKRDRTAEEFLHYVHKNSFMVFHKWEETPEYHHLLALLLQEQYVSDLFEIYKNIRKRAMDDGDDKAIATMLKLKPEIDKLVKQEPIIEEPEPDDDLDLS